MYALLSTDEGGEMRPEARRQREEQIEAAAYNLLDERGYAGLSMLGIAKAANASNETLYRWYGDKQGLFKALVRRNAEQVRQLLEENLAKKQPTTKTLKSFGPLLLELLLGPKAIALNRAAAADSSGELGSAIAQEGRARILPLLSAVIARAQADGLFKNGSSDDVADVYVRLLVGDLQIRRAIGVMNVPAKAMRRKRSDEALAMIQRLFGGESN